MMNRLFLLTLLCLYNMCMHAFSDYPTVINRVQVQQVVLSDCIDKAINDRYEIYSFDKDDYNLFTFTHKDVLMNFSSNIDVTEKLNYQYKPFIMDGTCEWIMTADYGTNGTKTVISSEDTLILGKTYKKVYRAPCSHSDKRTYEGAIREEDKQVYFFDTRYHAVEESENMIYDFNLKVGERIKYRDGRFPEELYEIEVSCIDTIEIEGIIRRKFFFGSIKFTWTEGIGTEYDFIRPTIFFVTGYDPYLTGVWQKGKSLFCKDYKCSCSDLLPISEQISVSDFHILQNPIRNRLLSIMLKEAAFSKVDIYSWSGELLLTKDILIRNGILEIPLEGLQAGKYIVILSRSDNSRESARIIVL